MSVRRAIAHGLVLALLAGAAGPVRAAESPGSGTSATAPDAAPARPETLSADEWCTRIAEALRVRHTMSARAHMVVHKRGEPDLRFHMDIVRQPWEDGARTVFEMREDGDTQSVVSELESRPGKPMTNWFWDLRSRRWAAVRGLLGTDPFADTLFRHEDLWLADPVARREGTVRRVEQDGRELIELQSAPYHYYQRVVTRVDPETSLPVTVRFIDNTGTPIREQRFESVEMVDGRPFPKVIRLRDLMDGAESVMTYEEVDFTKPIPESFFDLSFLNDRIEKGVDPVPLDALREPGEGDATPRDAGGI